MSRKFGYFSTAAVAALAVGLTSAPLRPRPTIVGLVTKTNTNPFFVKMKEGFEPRPRSSA